jgi:hypothetical protein
MSKATLSQSVAMQISNFNKKVITAYHEHITYWKQVKRDADQIGEIGTEYQAHEELKYLKKELAKMVIQQKQLKAILQGK